MMNATEIFYHFYPDDTPLRSKLLQHSLQVWDKSLAIAASSTAELNLNLQLVADGALLHDIGISFCHAPGILCEGDAPYLSHGVIGAELLRQFGAEHNVDLELFARICERHTGSGLTAEDIRVQNLPLPERDFLPETPEEKLVCLADKFFSKSGDMREKSLSKIRASMLKFGATPLARFDELCRLFEITE